MGRFYRVVSFIRELGFTLRFGFFEILRERESFGSVKGEVKLVWCYELGVSVVSWRR